MKLWIDLDNSPHVLLFAPIVRELERRGIEVAITVRDFAQTVGLAEQHGLKFTIIGRHCESASKVAKVTSTLRRAAELAAYGRKLKADAAISQGSRALVLASKMMGIRVMTLYDYEFASCRLFNLFSDRVAVPDVIPVERLRSQGLNVKKLLRYPGLKEEVYVYGFEPDESVMEKLQLDRSRVIVTVRPPAQWAHYHHERSEIMFGALMERLKQQEQVQTVIPARTEAQAEQLRKRVGADSRFRIFSTAVDGLSLMWCSDLVFSGGGTMTREAALLGINVYTIFGGRMGAADESLIRDGRLKILREPVDLDAVRFENRAGAQRVPGDYKHLAGYLAQQCIDFASRDRSVSVFCSPAAGRNM